MKKIKQYSFVLLNRLLIIFRLKNLIFQKANLEKAKMNSSIRLSIAVFFVLSTSRVDNKIF